MQAVKLCTNKTELKNTLNAPVTCALLITIRLSIQFIWWLEWDWISITYSTTAGVMGTSCRYQLHYKPQNYCLLSTNTANLDKLSKRSCKNKENLLIEILHKRGPAPRRERYRRCYVKSRVPEPIPVLGSQPAGDVNHKPKCRLPLVSARPAVIHATLKRAATNFAAWWTEAQWVWTVCLILLPDSVATAIWTQALLRLSPAR